MSSEMVPKDTGELVSALSSKGLGEMLKPLIREIHLFDSYVSGTARLQDPSVLEEVREGDKLSLMREESRFDSNAIVLLTENGKKLGYVPEKDNAVFARLLDAGKMLVARIRKIERKGSFFQIGIGIDLVDF